MFRNTLIPISTLFFAIAALAVGYGLLMTFVGVYLKQAGLSELTVGVINAAFFLGAMSAAIFSQKMIATVGHARSFSAFSALMAISFLGHALSDSPLLWAFLRFVSGFAFYAVLIVLESWLNAKSTTAERGRVFAIYSIVLSLAVVVGQLILTIEISTTNIFIFSAILVLVSLISVANTKIKQPELKPFERYSFPKLFALAPSALLGSFVGGFYVGGLYTMLPLYVLNTYNSVDVAALGIAIAIVGGLLAQWPVGFLSDKYGRRRLLVWAGFFSALVFGLLLVLPNQIWLFYLLHFLVGTSMFSIYPLSVARANDMMDETKDLVEVSRSLLFTYSFGSFLAPLILGIALTISVNIFFSLLLIIGFLLGLFVYLGERVPDEKLSVFVPVPATSADVLAEMDPRQDEDWVEEHKVEIDVNSDSDFTIEGEPKTVQAERLEQEALDQALREDPK